MSAPVLAAFGLEPSQFDVRPYGSGHINKTFLAANRTDGDHYILQKINTRVFKRPEVIARNHQLTWEHLARTQPGYLFPRAIPARDGTALFQDGEDHWRLMPYVPDTVTIDQADSPRQAYEAAKQFGRFARLTSDIDLACFEPTIPDFHNLTLRYASLQGAIQHATRERRAQAVELIEAFLGLSHIAETYATLMREGALPNRLMHHDTKINNVLLREGTFEGVCVIDLDTLMPGKVLSDLGDMIRTYLSPVSEEERDVDRIAVREAYFTALVDGYLSEMRDQLTSAEKEHLFYAGQFMIYMQGIRFLADYLNGDVYYPNHNLDRARNQLTLLRRLSEKEQPLQRIIRECL